jgi:hypothetical protein
MNTILATVMASGLVHLGLCMLWLEIL